MRKAGKLMRAGLLRAPTDDPLLPIPAHRPVNPWHAARARSLRRGWCERLASCGTELDGVVVFCAACGATHPAKQRCTLRHHCTSCARHYWAKTQKRYVRALGPVVRELRRLPRRAPVCCADPECKCARLAKRCSWELRLLTLTVRHTHDLERDFDTLQVGWKRLRAWFAKRGFRKLRYVKVVEVTPSDGGHVHLHCAIALPPICFDWLTREWRSAVEDAGARGPNLQSRGAASAEAAARYVAKYATKGSALPDEQRAAWHCATYGRRIIATSRGLLQPDEGAPCGDCTTVGALARLVLVPVSTGVTRTPGNEAEPLFSRTKPP